MRSFCCDPAHCSIRHCDTYEAWQILGELEGGVGNLKDHANNMLGEMNLQTKLLDEMDGDVDGAQQGLMAETDRATAVRKASSNCRLYLCILLLLGVLIALLVA